MRNLKAKKLRKLAVMLHNPRSKGLLHEGLLQVFRGKEKDDWRIKGIIRQWAKDSWKKIYRSMKGAYTRHRLPDVLMKMLKEAK